MDTLLERCAGLDVHKASVTACLHLPPGEVTGKAVQHRFGTTTNELLALADWLASHGVTHVAMEATGVYWKPVYYVLEDRFEVLLVNAAHIKNVPGRKTDANDAAWIADLLAHGLVRASFVPPKPIRRLRDLTRYRKAQVNERTRAAQRMEKVLQDAGVKLSSVASNVLGKSGRAMLDALVQGTHDPAVLAELAKGKLRPKIGMLREALNGRFDDHHAMLVAEMLTHIDFLEESIGRLDAAIAEQIKPYARAVEVIDSIPGVNQRGAEVILAEIGADMTRFPTAGHLASWAGMCPGNNESAGKYRAGTIRHGSPWLKTVLVEAANAAARSKTCYLSARYYRLKGRRGHNRAAVATGHAILVIAHHLISRDELYSDLGAEYYVNRHSRDSETRRLVRRLQALGNNVSIEANPT
ncbi:MAG: transposase [Frankiales bacterium]|nr:transposase [Frankiales bacterium]